MIQLLSKFFNFERKNSKIIETINSLEPEISALEESDILKESSALKARLQNKLSLEEILPRAFALVRETAKRVLNQRHFDVQLLGGLALHQGKIAEMRTGEGKTLAATLPAYL